MQSGSQCSERAQNQILINSSETADGVSTPDSVMIPEMRSGGWESLSAKHISESRVNIL
jgi:hypothetical protein